jgi:hypothetical protein
MAISRNSLWGIFRFLAALSSRMISAAAISFFSAVVPMIIGSSGWTGRPKCRNLSVLWGRSRESRYSDDEIGCRRAELTCRNGTAAAGGEARERIAAFSSTTRAAGAEVLVGFVPFVLFLRRREGSEGNFKQNRPIVVVIAVVVVVEVMFEKGGMQVEASEGPRFWRRIELCVETLKSLFGVSGLGARMEGYLFASNLDCSPPRKQH